MAKKKPAKPADAPNFEESLERLEAIVQQLEDGALGLDESLKQYEQGVALLRRSYELLRKAERKIEVLAGVDAEGNPSAESFDDQATFAAGGPRRGRQADRTDSAKDRQPAPDPPPSGENTVDGSQGLF